MIKKLNILRSSSHGVIVDYEEGKELYNIISQREEHTFGPPTIYIDDGSYNPPSGKYYEIYREGFYFSPYDLAEILGYI